MPNFKNLVEIITMCSHNTFWRVHNDITNTTDNFNTIEDNDARFKSDLNQCLIFFSANAIKIQFYKVEV